MTEQAYRGALEEVARVLAGVGIAVPVIDPPDPDPDVDPPEPAAWSKPWFGSTRAPWAVPSRLIPSHPENAKLRGEFFEMCDGGVNINSHRWAIAVYRANADVPDVRIEVDKPEWCNLKTGAMVPWDAAWTNDDDADSYVSVVDWQGRSWSIWGTRYDRARNVLRCKCASLVLEGYKPHGTDAANIWRKSNGFEPDAGGGFQLPAMLTMRGEIEEGRINHALRMGLPRPSKGRRFAPATKHIGGTGSDGTGRLGMGARVAFDGLALIDLEIWINRFPLEIRGHMLAIGVAVRDYGFIVVDHSATPSVYFENDLTANWGELGLTRDTLQTALHSLLKPNLGKARILAEPVFEGGDLNETAVYRGVEYPA